MCWPAPGSQRPHLWHPCQNRLWMGQKLKGRLKPESRREVHLSSVSHQKDLWSFIFGSKARLGRQQRQQEKKEEGLGQTKREDRFGGFKVCLRALWAGPPSHVLCLTRHLWKQVLLDGTKGPSSLAMLNQERLNRSPFWNRSCEQICRNIVTSLFICLCLRFESPAKCKPPVSFQKLFGSFPLLPVLVYEACDFSS